MRTITNIMVLLCCGFFLWSCGGSNKEEAKDEGTQKTKTEEEILADLEKQAADGPPKKALTLKEVWASEANFTTCESILYDEDQGLLYVSNINGKPTEKDGNGFISQIKTTGEVVNLKWIDGLDAPKGMGIHDGKLYVTNITEVVVIDIAKGAIESRHEIEGAKFLNDITIDNGGGVYISDSADDKIHKLLKGKLSVWMEGASLNRPNGLSMENGRMFLASQKGSFSAIDLITKEVEAIVEGIGAGDGLVPVGGGNHLVSDWNGQVFFVDPMGKKTSLLDTRDKKISSADIEYIPKDSLLLVPTFGTNKVIAYKLQY